MSDNRTSAAISSPSSHQPDIHCRARREIDGASPGMPSLMDAMCFVMIRRSYAHGNPPIIHSCRQLHRGTRGGFTLLELLVVLVVVAIMVSMAMLSFGVLGRDRQAEEETRRFWTVLQQAREESELQAEDLG